MSINSPLSDPTLDPVTGVPLDASYATQYQVPLGSQPINLEELNAQGKQSNWLYPDNLPPVVARLQARDLTNPGNAQDLSTDGKRNLNVNIAASDIPIGGGGGGISKINLNHQLVWNNLSYSDNAEAFLTSYGVITIIYGITFAMMSVGGAVGNLSLQNRSTGHNLWSLAIACGPNGQMSYTEMFPYGIIPSADGLLPEIVDDLKLRTPFNDGIVSFGLWWK